MSSPTTTPQTTSESDPTPATAPTPMGLSVIQFCLLKFNESDTQAPSMIQLFEHEAEKILKKDITKAKYKELSQRQVNQLKSYLEFLNIPEDEYPSDGLFHLIEPKFSPYRIEGVGFLQEDEGPESSFSAVLSRIEFPHHKRG